MPAARDLLEFLARDRYLQVTCTLRPRDTADAALAQRHEAHGPNDDAQQTTRRDPLESYWFRPALAGQRGSRNSRNLHGRHALGQSNRIWH